MKIANSKARRKAAPPYISHSTSDTYAILWLRQRFGLAAQRAKIIAALAGIGGARQ
jgi:hypothetical protein